MTSPPFYVMVLCFACVLTGCRTAKNQDVFHYTGQLPVWIFIPSTPWESQDTRGFPAQIALPPLRGFTTNRIEVTVDGEVAAGGTLHLPPGSTVLQAISCSGGFTEFAHKNRPRIIRQPGKVLTLYLHWRRLPGGKYREVWVDTSQNGSSQTDYPLENGDRIVVQKAILW